MAVLERDMSRDEQGIDDLRSQARIADKRIDELTAKNGALARRLLCMEDYGGHDWVFVGKAHAPEPTVLSGYAVLPVFTWTESQPKHYEFECSRCGHTRSFKWGELSKKEQDALTVIGLGGE
jgi:hypothetical protein